MAIISDLFVFKRLIFEVQTKHFQLIPNKIIHILLTSIRHKLTYLGHDNVKCLDILLMMIQY